MDTEPTPADLRANALRFTLESAVDQRLAFLQSGDWREVDGGRYRTFPEFIAARFGEIGVQLAVAERREIVAELTGKGVKVVDQAAALGVDDRTVERDRKATNVAARKPSQPKPVAPNPTNVGRTPTSEAARKALEAEKAAAAEQAERQRKGNRWVAVGDAVRSAITALEAAIEDDPRGDAMRAALTRRSAAVASSHVELLATRFDSITALIDTARADVIGANKLRRIK